MAELLQLHNWKIFSTNVPSLNLDLHLWKVNSEFVTDDLAYNIAELHKN